VKKVLMSWGRNLDKFCRLPLFTTSPESIHRKHTTYPQVLRTAMTRAERKNQFEDRRMYGQHSAASNRNEVVGRAMKSGRVGWVERQRNPA